MNVGKPGWIGIASRRVTARVGEPITCGARSRGQAVKIGLTVKAVVCLVGLGLANALLVGASAQSVTEAYAGPKKTVFVDVVGAAEAMSGGARNLGTTNEGLNAMLVDALISSGRFVVVERVALGDIQLEQDLGKGATTTESAAPEGRLLGASAVVRATVTKFESIADSSALQIGLPLGRWSGAAAGVAGQRAVVEFNLRIIDTGTGQVVGSFKASGTASATSANVVATNLGSGASVGASNFKNTPIGEAAESAIGSAVRQIVTSMAKVPWSATVVAFDNGKVYVNAGASHNLQVGTRLHVYRKDKVLTDPNTGVLLEVLMTDVGAVQVQSVGDKVSIATLTHGDPPARGDLLRLD